MNQLPFAVHVGNQVLTRDQYGKIAKGVTLITVDVKEEANDE